MPRLTFDPIFDSYLLVAAIIVALILLIALLRPISRRVGGGGRAGLIALRAATILLFLWLALRPTLVYTTITREPATVILLIDRSRSMSVPDEVGGRTRWQAQRLALERARDALRTLQREFELKVYTFDSQLHPAEVADGLVRLPDAPDGRQTALGAVLDDALRPEASQRVLGVILLGDGAQTALPPRDTPPQFPVLQMKQAGQKLYTVAFGKARGLGQARDVSLHDLTAADRVFVKNELAVTAQVRAEGYLNQPLVAKLLFETSPGKMEIVAEKPVTVTESGRSVPVEFIYAPQTEGEHKLTIEIDPQRGELLAINNRQSSFVQVLGGGLKVLYLEGALRAEQKFLRRSLDASPDIHVDYVRLDPRDPNDRPPQLAAWLGPRQYDVYLLGDVDSSAFEPGELAKLAESVSRGAGLVAMGGYQSFGPGGYASTPLAGALPVKMDALERQQPGEPIRADTLWPGPLRMMPALPVHFALRLGGDEAETLAVWQSLWPLDGANRFAGLKPGAEVLAEAGPGKPLLVAQTVDDGRVLAFAGDTTWRWCLRGNEAAHKRFWRQLILWAAKRDAAAGGNVWLKLARRRVLPGQRLDFTAGVESATGEPVADAAVSVEVLLPDRTQRQVGLLKEESRLAGSFRDTVVPGDYKVRVTARRGQTELGKAEARFSVVEHDMELDIPSADVKLMQSLPALTKGENVLPEELPALIQRLTRDTEQLKVQTTAERTLWDTWSLLLLIAALMSAEWYLRKRWGLV